MPSPRRGDPGVRHGSALSVLRGREGGHRIAAAAAHGGKAGDAGAEAGQVVRPQQAAGEGIERMQIPVHTDDEAVTIQQEGDVTAVRGLPLPEKLAGAPVNGGDAFVEAGEDEIGEVHGGRRLAPVRRTARGRCGGDRREREGETGSGGWIE